MKESIKSSQEDDMPQESVGVRDINQGSQPHLCRTPITKVLGAAASPVTQYVALGVWLLPRWWNQNPWVMATNPISCALLVFLSYCINLVVNAPQVERTALSP